MSNATSVLLPGRGVVSVTGEDAAKLLQGLVTSDLDALRAGTAAFAGLLSPQGKLLFEFFVLPARDGYLLETAGAGAADLVKRLMMYKLRAKVAINDLSASRAVIAAWGGTQPSQSLSITFADPRDGRLGVRIIVAETMAGKSLHEMSDPSTYDAHRVALGIGEAGRDYPLGDTFPHEANFDLVNGISFSKGCYVGQELVARMQNKTVVRRRVVRVRGAAPLAGGSEIGFGEAVIGKIGTVAGREALALLRLDRATEARDKGQALTAGGVEVAVHAEDLDRYRRAVANRPTAPDLPS